LLNAYTGDVSAEQIRSDNATSSGVKFQFKSSGGKNLASENPLGKNVSRPTWSKKVSFLATEPALHWVTILQWHTFMFQTCEIDECLMTKF